MKKITAMVIITGAASRPLKPPPPRMFQFQKPPAWRWTITSRFIDPASRITVTMTKPSETS